MSADSSIEKENSSTQNLLEDAVKDKLFNKVFAYIFISFLISNWRDIFILLKSKDDVMYTLSIVFVGEKIPLLGNLFLPSFVAHFVLPFIYGVVASILAPLLTLLISLVTSTLYAKLRKIDEIANKKEQIRTINSDIKKAIKKQRDVKKYIEQEEELESLEKRLKEIRKQIECVDSDIIHIIKLYREKGESLNSVDDFYEFFTAVKNSSFRSGDTNDRETLEELLSKLSDSLEKIKCDANKKVG
ncbi:TPA: hypothetical protein KEV26_002690 [Escherichia coli]|uniref:hypothetical protein n=1 Tax=Escherichia coli TaxID=562 RepID=UPI001B8F0422|nr:hypothetical protein [Escherichia coli]HBC5813613.1 hypothetical protein [Escherichia coli]